ncbi:MAG: class I SAM-dependent methyltransferase [Thermoplasmata archaeon]
MIETGSPNPGGSHSPGKADLDWEILRFLYQRGDHVDRYRWAASLASRKDVVDLGCGHGFGALFIEPVCHSYLGVDVDSSAISWARENVSGLLHNAVFRHSDEQGSVLYNENQGEFDLAISFEVIEHLYDPVRYIRNARQLVKKDGLILFSTPNGALSRGNPRLFMSPFHVREYTIMELRTLLSDLGAETTFFGQGRWDRLDTSVQALRRLISGRSGSAVQPHFRSPQDIPRWRSVADQLVQLVPSQSLFWQIKRIEEDSENLTAFTHILALVRCNR